ncbi:hypothetical protein CP8484711_0581B, partial [Chlamydia psittaci 84-8471/1]
SQFWQYMPPPIAFIIAERKFLA